MTQDKQQVLYFHSYHRNTIKQIDEAVWLDSNGDHQEEQYEEDREYIYTLGRDKP
jgi:hypothetical protein